jgi:hypothetical protein
LNSRSRAEPRVSSIYIYNTVHKLYKCGGVPLLSFVYYS